MRQAAAHESRNPNCKIQTPRIGHFWLWLFGFGVLALGLARYLAEALCLRTLFSSPLAVGGVALAGAGLGLVVWTVLPPSGRLCLGCAWPALFLPLPYILASWPEPRMGLVLLAGALLLVGASYLSSSRAHWALPTALALVVSVSYLRTLGRAVGEADTFEFQVVASTLGIAHPTGYPLYIILGRLFSFLPFGSVAWRVNLASAVCAVGAVVLVFLSLRRLVRQPLAAFLSALALAFSRVLWSQAVVAEVYALNLLFVGGVLWLVLALLEGGGERRLVGGLALLLGLSLTNHLTTLLLLPAVGLGLLLARPRLGWRGWLGASGLFLAGLAFYAYIPLRWPALHDGRWMGVSEFLAYVTGRQFGGALQGGLLRDPTRYAILGRLLVEPFGWPGVGLAVLGLGWLAARRWRVALVSVLALLPYCLYGLIYLVPDISVFLLPAHLFLALWMGLGVAFFVRLVRRRWSWLACFILVLFSLLPLSRVWLNLPAVDQSGQAEMEQWGRYVLSLPLERGAAVLADGVKFAPLYYLQQVEGVRPDLDLAVHFAEEEYRADLLARLADGQTVYLARYLPHLTDYYLRSLGSLVEVGVAPLAEPPSGATSVGAFLGPAVELLAFDLEEDPQGRPLYHLTLYWRAATVPQDDLEVRLRLLDERGEIVWASDGSRPVGGNYPTNAWPVGAVVPDYHAVSIPPWLGPGPHTLQVALLPPFSDGEGVWCSLGRVTPVEGGGGDVPHHRAILGAAWLTGYDLPSTVTAGSPVVVDLAWTGVGEGGAVRLEWVDGEGRAAGGMLTVPAGATRSRVELFAPDAAGAYRLRVGWEGRRAFCRWLAPASPACDLAAVQVEPGRDGLADFDGRILLVAAEVGGEGPLRPGGVLPVTLHWRALQGVGEDYTVTVQLLGPDGLLHGQVDSWPVQGTLPTSRWVPGEGVADPYRVPLAPDGPAGRYQVTVGLYLLATMERLPVVDAAGNPVADHVVVGEVEVTAP